VPVLEDRDSLPDSAGDSCPISGPVEKENQHIKLSAIFGIFCQFKATTIFSFAQVLVKDWQGTQDICGAGFLPVSDVIDVN
jgi:hypothetical protein